MIILGVTFLAFLTATVTSFFVSSQQQEAQEKEDKLRAKKEDELVDVLQKLEERLAAIESKLERD